MWPFLFIQALITKIVYYALRCFEEDFARNRVILFVLNISIHVCTFVDKWKLSVVYCITPQVAIEQFCKREQANLFLKIPRVQIESFRINGYASKCLLQKRTLYYS